VLIPVKKDSPRMVPKYEHLQEERGGQWLSYPYRPQRLSAPVRAEKRRAEVVMGNQLEFFCGNETLAATCGTNTVWDWDVVGTYVLGLGLGPVFMEYNVPGAVTVIGAPEEITMLNPVVAEEPISHANAAGEEDVIEFRVLPPRVESIASLRGKIKLSKTASDFAKEVRTHAFQIENEAEEQSE
jgi:hypothetical protein